MPFSFFFSVVTVRQFSRPYLDTVATISVIHVFWYGVCACPYVYTHVLSTCIICVTDKLLGGGDLTIILWMQWVVLA